jgi:hypothetical protein
MVKREFLLATLVGVILFISDLLVGWMSFILGPIPVIFIIALVIGIIAGNVGDAVKATFLTWLLGILLGCLLAPVLFADLWSEDVFLPLLPLIIMMWSTRGMFIGLEFEGNWIEALAVAAGLAILWLVVTPMLYMVSFLVAAIGGIIGTVIYKRLSDTPTETIPAY